MNLKELHKSKTVRGIIIGLGIAVLILIIFQAGIVTGYHKARFGARFGDNFNRNFMDPRRGRFDMGVGDRNPSIGGHGAVGKIVSIALPQIIVATPDNLEKTIIVKKDTLVRQFREEVTVSDLKVGDSIVVLGTPNDDGQVEAKLIRTVPQPPERSTDNQTIQ